MTWCQEYTLQPNPWSSTTPLPLSYSDCCFISLEFPLDRKSKDSNIPELNFWQFPFAAWLQAIRWSLKRYCRPRWRVAQSWSTWKGDRIAQALPKGLPAVAKTGIRSLNAWIPIAMAVSSPWLLNKSFTMFKNVALVCVILDPQVAPVSGTCHCECYVCPCPFLSTFCLLNAISIFHLPNATCVPCTKNLILAKMSIFMHKPLLNPWVPSF